MAISEILAEQHPIRFRSADEFKNRAAWRDGVDPTQHKPAKIVGDYAFAKSERLPCGLKSCRTTHQHGYVIRTADGLETHIGRHCGKRYFGVQWGEIQSVFNQALEERSREEFLAGVLMQRDQILTRARTLADDLAAAVGAVRDVLQRIHKEPLIVEAWERVLRANGAIQVEREVDAATAERMNLTEKQKRYFETTGRVAAVEVATQNPGTSLPGHFYGAEIKTHVIPYVDALSKSALTNLNPRQRKGRVKEIESIQSTLNQATNCLERMRVFLSPANLRELAKLPVSRSNQRAERVLRQFAEIVTT